MLTAAETKVDEAATLSSFEAFIGQRCEAARIREILSQQYRQVSVCESEERRIRQEVEQLEGRLKTFHKQLLFGTVKVGEQATLKQQLIEAKEALAQKSQQLEEQRELFCLGQESLTQLTTEINGKMVPLRDDLIAICMQRFHEEDTGLYGKRGAVCWMDNDQNSPDRWKRQWRGRAFRFLLNRCLEGHVEEASLQGAMLALFRGTSFVVRVRSGFVPVSVRSKDALSVGEIVAVPERISFEEGFEEIARRRVQFVTEA